LTLCKITKLPELSHDNDSSYRLAIARRARARRPLAREPRRARRSLPHSIRKWEMSSHAIPAAMYAHLCRVVDILEGEGARFTGDGVYLQRASPNDSEGVHVANAGV